MFPYSEQQFIFSALEAHSAKPAAKSVITQIPSTQMQLIQFPDIFVSDNFY